MVVEVAVNSKHHGFWDKSTSVKNKVLDMLKI